MDTFLLRWMSDLLRLLGLDSSDGGYKSLFASVVVVVSCVIIWRLIRYILLRARKIKDYIDSPLEVIFADHNLKKIALTISVIIFYVLMPLAFKEGSEVGIVVRKALDVMLVWMFTSAINSVVRTIFSLVYRRRKQTNAPLKGFMQIIQIVIWIFALIIIISILINKSPVKLLTGLGASLAVMSFVFKDTILNFVSGILLSSDKMVKVGDWIEMPSAGIDGTVIDMTLNTVKVQGWDNTISTVSPYTLTSGTFKNWQGMFASGGRRIARFVEVDINTVKFCSEDLLDRIAEIPLMADYVAEQRALGAPISNLELFRTYIYRYVGSRPWLNGSMVHMVRHLQSSETGVPLQIYAFTNTTAWVEYENIQSSLFEHIMAIAPQFEVRIFQRPSGANVECIAGVEEKR